MLVVKLRAGHPGRAIGELLSEVEFLEIENGLLAEGDVLGEKVVELVVDARVPDSTSEGEGAEQDERDDEIP
jgi:hypothetical protein